MCWKTTAVFTVSFRNSTTNQHPETPSTNNKNKLQPHEKGTTDSDWGGQRWAGAGLAAGGCWPLSDAASIAAKSSARPTHPTTRRILLIPQALSGCGTALQNGHLDDGSQCQWPHVMGEYACEAVEGDMPAGGRGGGAGRKKVRSDCCD